MDAAGHGLLVKVYMTEVFVCLIKGSYCSRMEIEEKVIIDFFLAFEAYKASNFTSGVHFRLGTMLRKTGRLGIVGL